MAYLQKIIISCICLIIGLIIIHYSNLDLKLQSLFFDFQTKEWLVHRDDLTLKFWFYRLPKYIIIAYGVIMIFWLAYLKLNKTNINLQKKLFFLISALVLVPLIVAFFKHYSPIYCPNHITEFYGGKPFISPLDIFDYNVFFNNNGKCSPAGHASGGFALLSLYFVMPSRKLKVIFLSFGLAMGSIMGFYQIAKGAHYLSDTLITLFLSWIICSTLEFFILKK